MVRKIGLVSALVLFEFFFVGCQNPNIKPLKPNGRLNMAMSEPNGLKIVVDYVTQIRGQDLGQFQTLFTVCVGSIFGAILVASLVRGQRENRLPRWRTVSIIILGVLAIACFLFFIFGLRTKFNTRREFCHKWMAYMITSKNKTTPELIKDFSAQRYGLYYSHTKDPNFVLRDENMPDSKFAEMLRGREWTIELSVVLALGFLFAAICIPTRALETNPSATKEIKITAPGSDGLIEAEGKLTIK